MMSHNENDDDQIEYIDTYQKKNQNQQDNNGHADYKVGQKRPREELNNNKLPQSQNQIRFCCTCGVEIFELRNLQSHLEKCNQMNQNFGKLYNAWNELIEQAIMDDNVEELKNMRAIYEHFRTKFLEGVQLHKETKRRKLQSEQSQHMDAVNGNNGHQEEEKNGEFKPENGFYQEDVQMENDGAGLECLKCKMKIRDSDFDKIVFLEACSHIVCKECLKEAITENYPDVECPLEDCEEKVKEVEIRQIISDEEYDKLQSSIINKVLEEDKNIVKCKCGFFIELVQGKVYYDYKKDDGKKLNKQAAKHMSQYRVRCPECGINFCTQCKAEPYHVGKTCAQYEKEKKMKKCKFCGANLKNERQNFCSKRACKNESRKCCTSFLACGHPCYGYNQEKVHPPCLHEDCVAKDESLTLGENADSFCVICYVQGLGEKSVIQLECKHMFHMDCIRTRLNRRWDGLAISIKFAKCPSCNQWMSAPGHDWLENQVNQAKQLEKKILDKCLQRAKHEGLDLDERLQDPKNEYYKNLEKFAFDHLNYYECYECKEPYFGGHRQCGAGAEAGGGGNAEPLANNEQDEEKEEPANEEEEMKEQLQHKPEQLICPKCASNVLKGAEYGNTYCKKHLDQFIDYKCRFCCSVALFFCFGSHHFCDPCHRKAWEIRNKTEKDLPQCKDKDNCPLKIDHPPNGHEYALGCGLCRELKLNIKEDENKDEIKDF